MREETPFFWGSPFCGLIKKYLKVLFFAWLRKIGSSACFHSIKGYQKVVGCLKLACALLWTTISNNLDQTLGIKKKKMKKRLSNVIRS